MHLWLVTLRAVDGERDTVAAALRDRLLPLLRERSACLAPMLAGCVNCAGELTYVARWRDRDAVTAFEADPAYRALLADLAPRLRVPPKRELWEILAD